MTNTTNDRLRGLMPALIAALFAGGCGPAADEKKAAEAVEVTWAKPSVAPFQRYVYATGNTAAFTRVEIRPRLEAHLEDVAYQPAQEVEGAPDPEVKLPKRPKPWYENKSGGPEAEPEVEKPMAGPKRTLLFKLDSRSQVAERDKARAELQVKLSSEALVHAELQKMEAALKEKAIPELQVIQKRSELQKAAAEVESAQAGLNIAETQLTYTKIYAPLGGRISRNYYSTGNLVGPSAMMYQPLAVIVRVKPIYAYLTVAESDVISVRRSFTPAEREAGMKNIPVDLGLGDEDRFSATGKFDYVDPFLDQKTGTVRVRAIFDNDDGTLLDGMFVRARIPVGAARPAVLVPERALGSDQARKFVLVIDEKNVAQYREVKIGELRDGLRVIEEGLKEGERLVVDGLLRVRPGATVTGKEVAVKPVSAAGPTQPTTPAKPAEKASSR